MLNYKLWILKKKQPEKHKLYKHKTTVGLGAGSTIAFIIEFLAEEVKKGLELQTGDIFIYYTPVIITKWIYGSGNSRCCRDRYLF